LKSRAPAADSFVAPAAIADRWGGSRSRLPVEVLRMYRRPGTIIIYRLSMLDLIEGGSWESASGANMSVRADRTPALLARSALHHVKVPRAAFASEMRGGSDPADH
jgi:2,4-dienoyl-CoA reductase-like NADH-dependent reductase (Old Yellow Enzyme family)